VAGLLLLLVVAGCFCSLSCLMQTMLTIVVVPFSSSFVFFFS
jgi:hypothetical protein